MTTDDDILYLLKATTAPPAPWAVDVAAVTIARGRRIRRRRAVAAGLGSALTVAAFATALVALPHGGAATVIEGAAPAPTATPAPNNGAAASAPGSPLPIGQVPTITSAADRALPLDGYLLTDQQWQTIDSAENAAEARCMARFGMTLPPQPAKTAAPNYGSGSTLRMAGHYGPQSLSFAQQWGYHPEGGLSALQRSTDPVAEPQTADYRTALFGTSDPTQKFGQGSQTINGQVVPEHGCIGEAKKEISGGVCCTDR